MIYDKLRGEVRHAAVASWCHGKNIGRRLWEQVRAYLQEQGITNIEVYARNTSLGFWVKMGFRDESDWLDHELFVKHGIRFKQLVWRKNIPGV